MKKFLSFIFILLLGFGGFYLYKNIFGEKIPKLVTEEEIIKLDKITVFGNHLNFEGSLVSEKNLDLILYNGEFYDYDIVLDDDTFSLSEYANEGINLESLDIGPYYVYLRSTTQNEDNEDEYKYYAIKNNTDYDATEYYTFSNVGNKIIINNDDDFGTLLIDVTKNVDDDIYDVVIDPGHGGIDSGAVNGKVTEASMTMKAALSLKKKLEKLGVKVKLTREEDTLTKDDRLTDYGHGGRAVIANDINAKYLFSIHMNSNVSSSVNGVEVYTPNNIDYTLAKKIAKNITSYTGINYSSNKINKISDGVYTRTFTQKDIDSSIKEYKDKNMTPYDITTKSNYFYMIREPGTIITGAYVDDRNKKIEGNPYYDSNKGVESYLIELCYLSNSKDLNNITNNMDNYTEAIADAFSDIFEDKD